MKVALLLIIGVNINIIMDCSYVLPAEVCLCLISFWSLILQVEDEDKRYSVGELGK